MLFWLVNFGTVIFFYHRSKKLLNYSPKTEAARCHFFFFFAFSVLHSSSLVSPRWEVVSFLVLQLLWLPPRENLQIVWLQWLMLRRERILNQIQPLGHNREAKDWGTQSFYERGLLSYFYNCSMGANFWLNTHLRIDCHPLQGTLRVGAIFTLSICCAPECQYLLERSLYTYLVLQNL